MQSFIIMFSFFYFSLHSFFFDELLADCLTYIPLIMCIYFAYINNFFVQLELKHYLRFISPLKFHTAAYCLCNIYR